MNPLNRRRFLQTSATVLVLPRDSWSAGADGFRFGLVTDAHYAETEPRGTRLYRESLAKMAECVDFMNKEKVAFLAELGDLKDEGSPPDETETLRFLETIEAAFARFNGPRYHVVGNHDVDCISKGQFLARTPNAGVEPGRSYYAFDGAGVRFIVLDACFKSDGSPYNRGDFDWTDANIPEPELEWLKNELAATDTPVIVFAHQLLDGEGDVYINNAAGVRSALEESGKVWAVFQGHHHAGQTRRINGIHYHTLKAMVEGSGPENNAYAIVEVSPGRLTVNGYRRAEDLEFAV